MIEKIKIKDFQSWKEVEFDLGQVTILIGQSRSGKSALVRAMRGLCYNMLGDTFVRKGSANTEVTITFDGGKWVRWQKGSKNLYEYFDGKDTLLFNKVGRAVPEDVAKLLGIWEVEFDGENSEQLNFMAQFGDVFMLSRKSYPATLVTRILGKVSRINEVYLGLKLADGDLKRASKERDRLSKNLDEFQAKLNDFVSLDAQKNAVAGLLHYKNAIVLGQASLADLERVAGELHGAGALLISRTKQFSALAPFKKINLQVVRDIMVQLSNVTVLKTTLESTNKLIAKLRAYDFSWVDKVDLNVITKLFANIENLKELRNQIHVVKVDTEKWEARLAETNDSIRRRTEELDTLKLSVKICPFCKRPMEQPV